MIAAAAADDCHDGLFPLVSEMPVLSDKSRKQLVLLKPRYSGWDALFERSKLNQKAWTLQERELSPRILYFTKDTMLFECRRARAPEERLVDESLSFRSKEPATKLTDKIDGTRRAWRCLDARMWRVLDSTEPFQAITSRQYDKWSAMVEDYVPRKLTNRRDRFPALSGLASEFAYLLDDQYVAGLWRKDLVRGLCWRWRENSTRKQSVVNYGPSWSWAKMDVPISYELARRVVSAETEDSEKPDLCDPIILNTSVIPEGKDPNGTVLSSKIRLKCQVVSFRRPKAGDYSIKEEAIKIAWGRLPQPVLDVYLLNMGRIGVGLVLIARSMESAIFQRVGIVSSTKWEWFQEIEYREITLV